nr:MAG: RNA-dependent RNA polymerase [Guiyang mito-like virus 12]
MTLKLTLQLKTASAIWQKAVKSFSLLSDRLVRAVPMIVGGQSRSWVKAVFHFTRLVMRIRRDQGSKGLALLLKASSLMIMRSVSGSKLTNSRDAGLAISANRQGLPRWIPVLHRKLISDGNRRVISLYLGFCTLYRVLDFKGKLSLSTITDPGKDITAISAQFGSFMETYMKWIGRHGIKPLPKARDREDSEFWGQRNGLRGAIRFITLTPVWKWMFTSGPSSKYTKTLAIANGWTDMLAVMSTPVIFNLLEHWRSFIGDLPFRDWLPWFKDAEACLDEWCGEEAVSSGLRSLEVKLKAAERLLETNPNDRCTVGTVDFLNPSLAVNHYTELIVKYKQGGMGGWREGGRPQFPVGALSIVEEPGKKRIVAMVDIWTQWALYPLHRALYKILGKIPEDGTFDQMKPVKALLKKAKSEGKQHFWSFDLSAATDRLPIHIQVLVLAAFTHLGFASTWASLLVDRLYQTPKEFATTTGVSAVGYKVGQPMGAYSSWGMLAMTHHALVQFSAWRVGHRAWFTDYAVLGDDIVICDRDVANEYVKVMDELGVKIGFHKSIISSNSSLEFAKRFFFKGEEASPLSLGGIAVGWLGPGFVPEVVAASKQRHGIEVTLYQIARYMGVGFKAASAAATKQYSGLPRILASAVLLMTRPGAPFGVPTLYEWYRRSSISGKPVKMLSKWEDKIFRLLWEEITDNVLGKALKRVKEVAHDLVIPNNGKKKLERQKHPLGDSYTKRYRAWFEGIVIPSFVKKWRHSIDEAGEKLREARLAWDKEGNLRKSLSAMEKALSLLALVPTRANIVRRDEPEIRISEQVLLGVLVPRSVKRWNTVAKAMGRKPTCRQGPLTRKGKRVKVVRASPAR